MQPLEECAGWATDIQIHTTKVLTTTGGTVWDAAKRCADYLESESSRIGLERPGVMVLELGAGCGLLGMLVARNCPAAAEVCLTEQAYGGALAHLVRNVEANSHLPNMASVTTCACDWTHFLDEQLLAAARSSCSSTLAQQQCCSSQQSGQQATSPQQEQQQEAAGGHSTPNSSSTPSAAELSDLQKLLSTPWDIIIGSDLVYNAAGVKGLPRVLAALIPPRQPSSNSSSREQQQACDGSRRGPLGLGASAAAAAAGPDKLKQPVMFYAHTKHRFDAMDVDLFDELQGLGFEVTEVIEAGRELPPPSPPPFSSLYPELRCAVFKISRPAAGPVVD